ncbi:MAG TPA: hypothetical protein VIX17_15715 [Pyrinomonadaceae bacterium]|jgi:hypothetical protein
MKTQDKPSDEFARFREATKTLLSVPKKAVDKEKAAYQKKRQRIKAKRNAA